MTESIQKKLLRVRPPRVKITYDVETGGAIEKKELPFIVGIFADLSGNRERPDEALPLKQRRMVDIDRDNFNDVMKKIGPRVDLAPLLGQVPELRGSALAADKALVFSTLDDFEPLAVVKAIPALNAIYHARGEIRTLQAKAESDDQISKLLDLLVEDADGATLDARQQALIKALAPQAAAGNPALRQLLIALHDALAADALAAAALAANGDPAKTDELTTSAAAAAAAVEAELKKWALPEGDGVKLDARLLVAMASAADTPHNQKKAKELVQLLSAPDALDPAKPTAEESARDAQRETAFTQLGYADAAAARAALAALALDLDGQRAKALLLLGGVGADDAAAVPAAAHPDAKELAEARQSADAGNATLALAGYLSGAGADAATVKLLFSLLRALSSDGQGAGAAKTLLSLRFLSNQVLADLQAQNPNLLEAIRKGVVAVIDEKVVMIDQQLSRALSAIMHSHGFKEMEQTWRGLSYLVTRTETSTMLKLRVFDATKDELRKDMEKAVEFDQSALFKLVYEAEYGTYGGFPYSLLVGGYEIGREGNDIAFLKKISEVAASAHAPFVAAASSKLFDLASYAKLDKPRDLKKSFEAAELIEWREFRDMEDARYVSLVLPRVLLRLPYGSPEKRNTIECEGLNFEEHVGDLGAAPALNAKGEVLSHPDPDSDNFLWGNPAYVLAERITNAFSLYNWTAAIRGVEGGGLVEGLPLYKYTSDRGATEMLCPTEVSITDRREKELNDLGFISLCHCKGAGKAAFFGGQTTNAPKKYFSDEANANARISAMLPYMLAASRFAHYIKVIMREKIGSFLTRGNVETYLNGWISNYVLLDDNATQDVKAAYPLRAASVVVTEVPGEPGAYKATAFLKPHFQLEELTTSIRLVANLPK